MIDKAAIDDALALPRLATAPLGSLERLEAERDAMARGAIPFDEKRLRLIDIQLAKAKAHADAMRSPYYVIELLARIANKQRRCPCRRCIEENRTPADVEMAPDGFQCLRVRPRLV